MYNNVKLAWRHDFVRKPTYHDILTVIMLEDDTPFKLRRQWVAKLRKHGYLSIDMDAEKNRYTRLSKRQLQRTYLRKVAASPKQLT